MPTTDSPPRKTFRDSWESLVLMVALILLGRIFLVEPFKIPSGSMEPTLFGHEDFGDRILTNKLAYVPKLEAIVAACTFLLLMLQGLAWSVDYARQTPGKSRLGFFLMVTYVALRVVKSFSFDWYTSVYDYIGYAILAVTAILTLIWYAQNFREVPRHRGALIWCLSALIIILGGMGLAWSQNAVAAEPRRFDVSIFEYSSGWQGTAEKIQDINYIKRLCGLPGERIMISGGDLFKLEPSSGKWRILRKWQERDMALQDAEWYPVSRAFEPRFTDPQLTDPAQEAIVQQELRDLAFPWTGIDNVPGVKLEPKALTFDGTQPLDLAYKFHITNIYLKQGRWPFRHEGCPEANQPSVEVDGIKWRNPNSQNEDMEAYVSNTWEGVQCPLCKHILFPIGHGRNSDGTTLRGLGGTNFFYGGERVVGDLKLELKLTLETAGSLHLEVGNNLRRAVWNIPGGGEVDEDKGAGLKGGLLHYVQTKSPVLSAGTHTLSLAYVDGTVIAILDGTEIERRALDVQPLPSAVNRGSDSIVQLSLKGCRGSITSLNLSRDLYYTEDPPGASPRDQRLRGYDANGNFVITVPDNQFLMLGDNSPSSSDGRVWGCVPRERLMGRAWIVAWPPSRGKLIR